MSRGGTLCLHTPRADCNQGLVSLYERGVFASTRPVQIATLFLLVFLDFVDLCLHTPRADCNPAPFCPPSLPGPLPPHAPCRLQRIVASGSSSPMLFASTRPVQIATALRRRQSASSDLCLHTPRADCNRLAGRPGVAGRPLPPHAPCRLQQVRIPREAYCIVLCLHTPRADCNPRGGRTRRRNGALPPHAPCRLQLKCNTLYSIW